VREVAARDGVPLGVRLQPSSAVMQELLDLVMTDPVVLVVVENWDEDVQVREQF